jgi:hypothetical protein
VEKPWGFGTASNTHNFQRSFQPPGSASRNFRLSSSIAPLIARFFSSAGWRFALAKSEKTYIITGFVV